MRLFAAVLGTVFVLAHTTQVAHAAEKHLFYVHGCCVKDKDDPKAKACGTIVQALRDSGFQVAFELRPIDVSDSEPQVRAFAARLAEKTLALIANGVAPEDITIAG